jgi:hypothetical protein
MRDNNISLAGFKVLAVVRDLLIGTGEKFMQLIAASASPSAAQFGGL